MQAQFFKLANYIQKSELLYQGYIENQKTYKLNFPNTCYEDGSEVFLFKSGSPISLSLPSNLGFQGPPFQPINILYDPRTSPNDEMDEGLIEFDPSYKETGNKMQVTREISSNKLSLS